VAAGRRSSDAGNQKSRLPGILLQRMSRKWKIQDWNAFQPEVAVVNSRVPADFNIHSMRGELPFRPRQFACRHRAVGHHVAVRPQLFNYPPSKEKRIRRGKHSTAALQTKAN